MESEKFLDEYDKLKSRLKSNEYKMMILLYNIICDDIPELNKYSGNKARRLARLDELLKYFTNFKDWDKVYKLEEIKTSLYEQTID